MIKVNDAAEFTHLIDALSEEIVSAHVHYRLYRNIHDALCDHQLVANQSRNFWGYTLQAHLNTCIQLLCRVYDQNDSALHLHSWLMTIKQNLHLFDVSAFRQRLKDNPFVDSLAKTPRKPDPALLDGDIDDCSTKNPLVKTLNIHRGCRIAHVSAKNVVSQRNIADSYPLTFDDLDQLLLTADTLLNRYSSLFAACTYSTRVPGEDDFNYIFKCVEEKVLESRAASSELRDKH